MNSTRVNASTLGIFVGIFVGACVSGAIVRTFVSGTVVGTSILYVDGVGAIVSRTSAESAEEGAISQGVFGKQARPGGHSADDPVGQGLAQVFDASRKSTPQ